MAQRKAHPLNPCLDAHAFQEQKAPSLPSPPGSRALGSVPMREAGVLLPFPGSASTLVLYWFPRAVLMDGSDWRTLDHRDLATPSSEAVTMKSKAMAERFL